MKTKKWLSLFMAVAMAISMTAVFAACNGGGDKITVTWYDGRSELRTEEIDKGSKATEWTPTKTGFEFKGWFEEASLTTAFDFDKALEEDTDIYAKWLSTEFVADTNEYYLVGSGSGSMSASNWATEYKPELQLTKDETADKANIYTIEVTLYAGDELQIVHSPMTNNDFWDGQMGIGYFTGCEKNSDEATDPQYYVVKDSTDAIVFQAAKGFGDSPAGWNAKLAEGKDGKYEIKLTTYPNDPSNNVIEFKFIEGIQALEKTHDMAFIGINGWTEDDLVPMTESQDKATWTGFITATDTEVVFKVYNKINKGYFGGAAENIIGTDTGITIETEGMGAGNIHLPAGKTYGVRYTVETGKVEVEVCDYYLVGTMKIGGNKVEFSIAANSPKMMKSADNTYTCDYEVTDVTADFSYLASGVISEFKAAFGCSIVGGKDWSAVNPVGPRDGNLEISEAGTYTFTLTISDGSMTLSAAKKA